MNKIKLKLINITIIYTIILLLTNYYEHTLINISPISAFFWNRNLVSEFPEFLKSAAVHCGSYPLMIFIDGVDMMENMHQAKNMEWIPMNIPEVRGQGNYVVWSSKISLKSDIFNFLFSKGLYKVFILEKTQLKVDTQFQRYRT